MNLTLYEKTDLICCRFGIQEIMNRVVIVTNPRQCLSHRHDIDTAHNNICLFISRVLERLNQG
jgi:hypothetical protein